MTTADTRRGPAQGAAGQGTSVADRVKALMTGDAQFRATMPLPAIAEAKSRPGLNLAQIVATVMEGSRLARFLPGAQLP
jgi:hypothetical protein